MDRPESTDALQAQIRSCAPSVLPDGLLACLEESYESPPRHYHSLDHVAEVAARFSEVEAGPGWRQPREVFLAILFHDAVYAAGDPDNEAASARLAVAQIERWCTGDAIDVERVRDLILATKRHGQATPSEVDADTALFLDCDMAILGASPERFAAYDEAIAREYAAIPADAYRAGRRAFAERVLASERIFLSDYFHERMDARARANLDGVVRELTHPA